MHLKSKDHLHCLGAGSQKFKCSSDAISKKRRFFFLKKDRAVVKAQQISVQKCRVRRLWLSAIDENTVCSLGEGVWGSNHCSSDQKETQSINPTHPQFI